MRCEDFRAMITPEAMANQTLIAAIAEHLVQCKSCGPWFDRTWGKTKYAKMATAAENDLYIESLGAMSENLLQDPEISLSKEAANLLRATISDARKLARRQKKQRRKRRGK